MLLMCIVLYTPLNFMDKYIYFMYSRGMLIIMGPASGSTNACVCVFVCMHMYTCELMMYPKPIIIL